MATDEVIGLIGVYRAEGGAVGEAKYLIGKMLGTAHCALCDVTHSPVRRKPEWDRMVARLGVRFRLLHLNELSSDVADVVSRVGSPVVLARRARPPAVLDVLLTARDLDGLDGSVSAFESALRSALNRAVPLEPI